MSSGSSCFLERVPFYFQPSSELLWEAGETGERWAFVRRKEALARLHSEGISRAVAIRAAESEAAAMGDEGAFFVVHRAAIDAAIERGFRVPDSERDRRRCLPCHDSKHLLMVEGPPAKRARHASDTGNARREVARHANDTGTAIQALQASDTGSSMQLRLPEVSTPGISMSLPRRTYGNVILPIF